METTKYNQQNNTRKETNKVEKIEHRNQKPMEESIIQQKSK